MGQANYINGFKPTIHPNSLEIPLNWKKSQMVFVNSMSDLFHEDIPVSFIKNVFGIMNLANWHLYQVLTKRSKRLRELTADLEWSKHIWMGVTVEDCRYKYRLNDLKKTDAKVKFISFEPLLGQIGYLDLDGIDWVIVGGESGPGARPMNEEWVLEIKEKCLDSNVPFFFKQWGGVRKKKAGRLLEEKIWDQMPSYA